MPQSNDEQGIPVTWPELLAESESVVEHSRRALKVVHELMVSEKPNRPVSGYFQSLAKSFAEEAIVLGPEKALPSFSAFDGFLPRAVGEFKPGINKHRVVSAIGVLDYLNVCASCGVTLPAGVTGIEPGWLPQIAKYKRDLTESECRYMAFAALAVGVPDLVPAFIGGGALAQRFRPGETFEFNTYGFVRYIAVAMLSGAGAEDIEPAWRDFLDCFPRKLASETLDWVHLMWAGRAVMANFERQPVAGVADRLHQLVTSSTE